MKIKLPDKLKKYLIPILVLAILGSGGYFVYAKFYLKASSATSTRATTAKVTRGDLDVTLTGTGTVSAYSSYDIVALVNGTIESAPFEEGASVKAGDLLYKIDDSDLSYSIQKSEDSITKLQLSNNQSISNLSNYTIVAPVEGRLSDFTLNVGDQVSNGGTICTISNENVIKATLQFSKYQVQKMKVGDKAQLVLSDYMYNVDGTVTHISNASKADSDGAVVYDVDITIDNPGAISSGLTVTGIVETSSGNIQSPGSSTISYATSQSVIAKASSSVKEIFVKNNEWVKAGQKILTLDSSSAANSIQQSNLDIKDAQISLNSQRNQLDDYNITSPIDGTVITKNYKAGDTIGSSSDSKVLMVVADLSKMKFTISVDELDIAKVTVGQKVTVTADALTGKTFEGEVTKVPLTGTTSNGVTTYDVEVTISDPGALKPGMNVNAEIQVESKSNTLYVPVGAVTKVGSKAYVYVEADNTTDALDAKQNAGSGSNNAGADMAGRQKKEVQLGINNDTYIEITSGLNEGDTVYLSTTSSSTTQTTTTKNQEQGGGGMGMMGAGGPPPQ